MAELKVGDLAPDFTLAATANESVTLSKLRGKRVILYFYPKDCTSGCTLQGQDFRDQMSKFKKLNTIVFGISRDKMSLHEKFKEKEQFNFELLSDVDENVCNLYDVIKDKMMYGKKVRGIERSTFLVDEEGKIRAIWRKVKVPGHVDEVLATVKALNE